MKNRGIELKCVGFTLAEILIALTIIGVVAALTVPTVIKNYQETQTISALKKFYTEISQAYTRAQLDNGTADTWNWGTYSDGASADKIIDILEPYLKITKRCGVKTGCFPNKLTTMTGDGWEKGASIDIQTSYAKMRLAEAISIAFLSYGGNCNISVINTKNENSKYLENTCGSIVVDLNGDKLPNRLGKDTFSFYITKCGLIPHGIKGDNIHGSFSSRCNRKGGDGWNGLACTAWVIKNSNMDYLRKDVAW